MVPGTDLPPKIGTGCRPAATLQHPHPSCRSHPSPDRPGINLRGNPHTPKDPGRCAAGPARRRVRRRWRGLGCRRSAGHRDGVDEGARQLLGHPPDEVVGKPAARLLDEDLPSETLREIKALRRWSGRVRLRHRNGHRVEYGLIAHDRTKSDTGSDWLLVCPIAGAISPEDKPLIEQSFQQSPCCALNLVDTQARLRQVNAYAEGALGLTEAETRGLRVSEFDLNLRRGRPWFAAGGPVDPRLGHPLLRHRQNHLGSTGPPRNAARHVKSHRTRSGTRSVTPPVRPESRASPRSASRSWTTRTSTCRWTPSTPCGQDHGASPPTSSRACSSTPGWASTGQSRGCPPAATTS